MRTSFPRYDWVLLVGSLGVLLGRAWQYLFKDGPYRVFLMDEKLLSPIVTRLTGMTWNEYATSNAVREAIDGLVRATGWVFVATALGMLALLVAGERVRQVVTVRRVIVGLALASSIFLLLMALLYGRDRRPFFLAQFTEYTAQWSILLFTVAVAVYRKDGPRLLWLVRLAAALTFFGHGLYALGFFPTPGPFVDMTIRSLGVTESFARQYLFWAGVLDMIVAVGILLPQRWGGWARRIVLVSAAYMVFWGFVTALARPWSAGFPNGAWAFALKYETQAFVVRAAHFMLPLYALLTLKESPPRPTREGSSPTVTIPKQMV